MRLLTGHSGPPQFVSRRRWLAQSIAAAGSIALASSATVAQQAAAADLSSDGVSHDADSIHQQVTIKVPAAKIYDVLTNAAQFQKLSLLSTDVPPAMLTAHPAQLTAEPGSAFSLFGGIIEGRQIGLVPAKRVVQAWRVNNWDAGLYSIARFELSESGGVTTIAFDHTGFPKGAGAHLAAGWKSHYWDGLAKFFAE
jgi:activator of HSP90 ATPase